MKWTHKKLVNHCTTNRDIADKPAISFESCQISFMNILGMKRVAAKYVQVFFRVSSHLTARSWILGQNDIVTKPQHCIHRTWHPVIFSVSRKKKKPWRENILAIWGEIKIESLVELKIKFQKCFEDQGRKKGWHTKNLL